MRAVRCSVTRLLQGTKPANPHSYAKSQET